MWIDFKTTKPACVEGFAHAVLKLGRDTHGSSNTFVLLNNTSGTILSSAFIAHALKLSCISPFFVRQACFGHPLRVFVLQPTERPCDTSVCVGN